MQMTETVPVIFRERRMKSVFSQRGCAGNAFISVSLDNTAAIVYNNGSAAISVAGSFLQEEYHE